MLFYQNLENIVFTRNQLFRCDELVILSGYVGPTPIRRLKSLPMKSTVVYGMYGCDGIQQSLHSALVNESKELDNVDILYSTIPVHAKCYIWKYKGNVVHALIGSANFSTNGLTTPFKEVLAETTVDTFAPLDDYVKLVLERTIKCEDAIPKKNKKKVSKEEDVVEYNPEVCSMPLYIIEDGIATVPLRSGINWGLAKLTGSHVNINDAYIRIGKDLIEHYPEMFPQKQECPSNDAKVGRAGHRHNDNIEIIWDDGTTMTGLLEGSVSKIVDGKKQLFPKQISTTPRKAELGKYLRKRMGISEGQPITYKDLQKYGRTTVDVSLQGEGIYYFDFSVTAEQQVTSNELKYVYKPKLLDKVAQETTFYSPNREYEVECGHCNEKYLQKKMKQGEGFREKEDDICPYCGKSNHTSMEWEFYNRKI